MNITGSKSHKSIDIKGEITILKKLVLNTLLLFLVPMLSVSVSSNASTVYWISVDTTPSLYSVGEHLVLAFNNQKNHYHSC